MSRKKPKLQVVLYPVFLVTCGIASALGLLLIWGVEPSRFFMRLLGTCVLVAVATAFTMSATRLVAANPPEDDDG